MEYKHDNRTSPKKLNHKSSSISLVSKQHHRSSSLHKKYTLNRAKSGFIGRLLDEHLVKNEGMDKYVKEAMMDSSPLQRKPLKNKVRRFRSMYYNPSELSQSNSLCKLTTTTPVDDEFMIEDSYLKKLGVETFYVKDDTIPRVTLENLVLLLDGEYLGFFDKIQIIDCRFEYEYQGGHINNAVNVNLQQQLEERFVGQDRRVSEEMTQQQQRTLMVFHCEFSSYRGPFMALHLRKCDRIINKENYPHLNYPNIVVLEGGYKSFFNLHASRCFPQCYVEMNDDKHKLTCERELTKFRESRKRILTKASSFHFGTKRVPSPVLPTTSSFSSTTTTTDVRIKHKRHNTFVGGSVAASFETKINENTFLEETTDGSITNSSASSTFSFSSRLQRRLSECVMHTEPLLQKSFADILDEKKKLQSSDDDEYEFDDNKLFSKYLETSDSESEEEITFNLLKNKNSLSNIDLCFESPTIRKRG